MGEQEDRNLWNPRVCRNREGLDEMPLLREGRSSVRNDYWIQLLEGTGDLESSLTPDRRVPV